MAFKLVSSGGVNVDPVMIEVEASGAISIGDHVSFSKYGSVYAGKKYITAINGPTALTLFAISAGSLNSGTALINVIPINQAQLWEADGTTTCAATHLFKAVAIEQNTVLNSLTEGTAAYGAAFVFMPIAIKGALTDKKLIGRFVSPNNLGGV